MDPLVKRHIQFQDFDALTEAISDWDLDLVQLESGIFRADVLQTFMSDVLISKAEFFKKVEQSGSAPEGYRTFVFLVRKDAHLLWRGHDVSSNDIMLFPESRELHSISDEHFHVVTFSISKQRLETYYADDRYADFEKVFQNTEVFRCAADHVMRLRLLFARFFELSIRDVFLLEQLKCDLIDCLLECCASSLIRESHRPDTNRVIAVAKAKELIEIAGNHPLRVADLAREAKVSARTLEYAFREQYQMSPKAYIQSYRLHQVRQSLKGEEDESKIWKLASRWGFWHMGQFASDYRKTYGELPRATFSRARSGC